MSLMPLTAAEVTVTTPGQVHQEWVWLGFRLHEAICAAPTTSTWAISRREGLQLAQRLYEDLDASAARAPLGTWQLMAQTLNTLIDNCEGDQLLGLGEALSMQLDVAGLFASR